MNALSSVSPMRAAVVFLLLSSGCIAIVSPDAGGEHCRLRGEETTCGHCLASRCRAEIDGACFDDAVLPVVERCAEAGDASCKTVPTSALGSCMTSSCKAYCFERSGTSVVHCTESFLAPALSCSCESSGEAPNDVLCDSRVYERTKCCAQSGWPRPALECTCNAVLCVPLFEGCNCVLSDIVRAEDARECLSPPGGHCCAIEDRCACRSRTCSGNEKEVSLCNKFALACPKDRIEVTSCSTRQ